MDLSAFNLDQNTFELLPLIGEVVDLFKYQAPEESPICDLSQDDELDASTFMVRYFGNSYKSIIRGMYHNKNLRFKDGCFDDSTVEKLEAASDVALKLMDDLWSVDLNTTKATINDVIDLFDNQLKQCEVKRIYDDFNYWQIQNQDVAWGDDEQMN